MKHSYGIGRCCGKLTNPLTWYRGIRTNVNELNNNKLNNNKLNCNELKNNKLNCNKLNYNKLDSNKLNWNIINKINDYKNNLKDKLYKEWNICYQVF